MTDLKIDHKSMQNSSTGLQASAWQLLETLVSPALKPALERIRVRSLVYHSARVGPDALFFCLTGNKEDGHRFAREAVSRGAAAVVASRPVDCAGAALVLVEDTRAALSLAAARYYGFPGNRLNLIGVTGTNGKTTTTYFIQSVYRAAGQPAAILGSNGLLFDGLKRCFALTTPQSLELQESLAGLRDRGARVVAMEVSSHALVQHRVAHCFFDSAVVTNITREHLDYHGTMESYMKAKSRIFTLLKQGSASGAILNTDATYYGKLFGLAGRQPLKITYGIESDDAVVRAVNLSVKSRGCYSFDLLGWPEPQRVSLQLPGRFNVYNALAAAAAAWKDRLEPEAVAEGLHSLAAVPGRLEEIRAGAGFTVVIDFAHTPDGLEQVLKLLRQREPGRLITVFGCPGERDRGKRPLMGRIAERYSDLVVVTADNPAGEDAATIMQEIRAGMQTAPLLIEERREAVRHALEQAGAGDMVLLAGKGAERYQLIGDTAVPYNEREVVEECLGTGLT